MLDQKLLDILIENIYLVKFSLFFFSVIFVALILWELGFLKGASKAEEASAAAPENKEPVKTISGAEVKEESKADKEEEYDPFRTLLKQREELIGEVEVVESSVLDTIKTQQKFDGGEEKDPEPMVIKDHLNTDDSSGGEPYIIEFTSKSELEKAAEKDTPEDPWQSMLARSVEEHKVERKKTIKIDEDEDAGSSESPGDSTGAQ
ncbi:MAG: hypothetical protein ABIH00_06795 [Armatimonadota bacterium]